MKFNARAKVYAGFILAVTLIIGVSIITYVSVKNLLDSVQVLSEPNERLIEYNQLLSEVYKLDRPELADPSEMAQLDSTDHLAKIQKRLTNLERNSQDPIEIYKLNGIAYNIEELLEVQKNLEDVKQSLTSRDFSKEALENLERNIRRQQEKRNLQNLERIRSRINPASEYLGLNRLDPLSQSIIERNEELDMEKVLDYLESNLGSKDNELEKGSPTSDSLLIALRKYMIDLTSEERQLRSRLSYLEQQLTAKNRELIIYVQDIITSLQNEALRQSRAENESAYALTFRLSIFLAILTLLGVTGSAAFIFAITKEIKKAEVYNNKLEEAKRKSDNLAKAKQEFLANMSHEIRNPLHVIQGYQEALAKTALTAEQREFLYKSEFASETLLGVVNDILDFSKLEAGKIHIESKPFEPKGLFRNCAALFENKAKEKGLDLILIDELPSDQWLIGDALRVNQIMNNLISNAIKFTASGSITVKIKFINGEGLRIQITDTGMGMSKEVKEGVFSAFNQGDTAITRKFGGTGLGLTIVKKLTQLMGGQIELDSVEGEGTTFTLVIPSQLTEPQEREVKPDVEVVYSLQDAKILLIDDDPIVLNFTKLLLKSLEANVTAFLGGVDFRDNFKDTPFDLAMVDIQMPEVSGFDVLRMLKNHPDFENSPVVALTANVFAKEQNDLIDKGFDGIVLKPFKERELMEQISSFIQVKKEISAKNKESNPVVVPKSYDLSTIRKFAMDDEELLEELVGDFYTQTINDLRDLMENLQAKDYKRLREITHQLSSRLGQFHIQSGKLAKEAEVRIKDGHTDEMTDKLISELYRETNDVLEAIRGDFHLLEEKPDELNIRE